MTFGEIKPNFSFTHQIGAMLMPGQNLQSYEKSIMFDPDKGFLELTIVRQALCVLLGLCLFLIIFIAFTARRKFQFDAAGLSNFAALFRVPVGAFTLSLPVFALLAASHRSEQTKQQMALTRNQIDRTDRQIQIASEQSKFSNYYKHLEEFVKYCDSHFNKKSFGIASPRKLHAVVYPNARQGDLQIGHGFLATFDKDIADLYSLLSLLATPEGRVPVIKRVNSDGEELMARYYISRLTPVSSVQFDLKGEIISVPGRTLTAFVLYEIQIMQTIDEVLAFDAGYISSPSARQLFEFSKLFSRGEISFSDSFDFEKLDKDAIASL